MNEYLLEKVNFNKNNYDVLLASVKYLKIQQEIKEFYCTFMSVWEDLQLIFDIFEKILKSIAKISIEN